MMIFRRIFFLIVICFCFSNRVFASLSYWEKLESDHALPQLLLIYDSLLINGENLPIVHSKKNLVLAKLAIENGEFQKAHQYLEKSIQSLSKISKDTSWNTQLILAHSQKCHLLYDTGHDVDTVLATALNVYNKKNIFHSDPKVFAQLCSDIAGMYSIQENHDQSIEFYKRAIKYENRLSENLGLMYNNLAYAYDAIGYTHQVLENYKKAQKIWSKVVPKSIKNNNIVFQNIITTYLSYGDIRAAGQYLLDYQKYFKSYVNSNDRDLSLLIDNDSLVHSTVDYLKSHIEYYSAIMQKDSAEKYIQKIQDLYLNAVNYRPLISPYVFSSVEFYAFKLKSLQQYEEAKKYFDLTRKYSFSNFQEMKYLANISILYYDQKEYSKSYQYLNQALKLFPEGSKSLSLYMLSTLKSELLIHLKREKEAEDIVREVIFKLLDGKKITKDLSQITYKDFHPLNSSRHISLLIKGGKIYEMLYLKSNNIKHLNTAHQLYNIASDMFQQYYLKGYYNPDLDIMAKQINEGIIKTIKSPSNNQIVTLLEKIENIASQHLWKKFIDRKNEFSEQHIKSNPSYQNFNQFNFDIKALQSHLKDGQMLIKYVVGEENIYAFKIQKNDLTLIELGAVSKWEKVFLDFFSQLKDIKIPYAITQKDLSKWQSEWIGSLSLSNENDITFILDDFLNAFPMEVLLGQDILNRLKSVQYSYSLSLLHIQQQTNYRAKNKKIAVFAPVYDSQLDESESQRSYNFKDLFFARKEADAIIRRTKGDMYIGDDATKQNFLTQASKYNLLHLAMHSIVDTLNYENSYLVFQNVEPLYYHELYQMRMPAQLVILSACNTGMGIWERGEGMMSLSRAFTYAGVSSTIHSLWEVPDRETFDLMQLFYEQLVAGSTPAEALLNAKRLFIEKYPLKKHPYYWSGFVLHGDVDMQMGNKTNYWWWVGFGLLIFLSGCMIYKKRKHSSAQ